MKGAKTNILTLKGMTVPGEFLLDRRQVGVIFKNQL